MASSLIRGSRIRAASPGREPTGDWVPFDDPRNADQFQRADIVFGPDMFDPRTQNGDRPFTDAVTEGRTVIQPADMSKTTAEVFGTNISATDLRDALRADVHSVSGHDEAHQKRSAT